MEKTKKTLMIISLCALAISCIMLILAVFKVKIFEGVPLRLLLVFSTIAVSCGISINELAVIKRKRILGFVGLGLLALSVVMAMIIFCSKLLTIESVFNRITGIVAVSSVLFIVIISLYSKLGKSVLGLQIPTYICLIALDIMISLLIGGVELFEINGMLQVFIVLIIVCVGLLIASSVISSKRKSVSEDISHNIKKVTISIVEYESLKSENESLKKENAELKAKLGE